MPSGFANAVAVDQAGAVWIAPGTGTAVLDHNGTPFDKSDDAWLSFSEVDFGLASVNDIAIDSANRKWFAGWSNPNTHGLVVLDDGGTPITQTDDLTDGLIAAGDWSGRVHLLRLERPDEQPSGRGVGA